MNTPRYFAIIPAAGYSLRMGQPKLLLPMDGRPMIAWTIAAWRQSGVHRVLTVARADDDALAVAARQAGAEVVLPPQAPPDMKASVQAALRHIDLHYAPTSSDAFLVAPADMPRLSAEIIDRLIAHHRDAKLPQILAPLVQGRRGHPVLFPWSEAARVFELPPDNGLNAIVEAQTTNLIPCDDLITAGIDPFIDIDTPIDFERLNQT